MTYIIYYYIYIYFLSTLIKWSQILIEVHHIAPAVLLFCAFSCRCAVQK